MKMNIQHILLFCFLSALCGGNTGLINANVKIFSGAEGGRGTMHCHLNKTGPTKFFCKGECKGDDILVKTDGVRANSGRYSITHTDDSSELGIMSVTITNLNQSDSGRSRCGFGKSLVPDSFSDFEVRVSHEQLYKNDSFVQTNTEGETVTYPWHKARNRKGFFFCKDPCKSQEDVLIEADEKKAESGRYSVEYNEKSAFGLYVTIMRVKKSDTGRYKCGYGRALSPESFSTIPVIVLEAPTTSKPNWTLQPLSTAASLSSGSGNPTVYPKTSSWLQAAAPTTSKPHWTLQPSSASTFFSSGSSTPSAFLPETTNQPAAAALTTSSAPTIAQTLSSSSGGSTTLVFPETTNQSAAAGYFPPVYVPVVVVLLSGAFLLFLYIWKKMKNKQQQKCCGNIV